MKQESTKHSVQRQIISGVAEIVKGVRQMDSLDAVIQDRS